MIQLPPPLVIELTLNGSIVIIKIIKKNKGHLACICGRAADSAYHLHFLHLEISFPLLTVAMASHSKGALAYYKQDVRGKQVG